MEILFFLVCLYFETGFHYVAEAGLGLQILLPKHPPSVGIIGVHHHTQILIFLFPFSLV
jgi:hypothetical protein